MFLLLLNSLHAMQGGKRGSGTGDFNDLSSSRRWEEQAEERFCWIKHFNMWRTPHVQHTANEWQTTEHNRHIRSNRVYQMNTTFTRIPARQRSANYPVSMDAYMERGRTNSPSRTQAKIAGQDRKVFTDKAAMEKYLNGRIKAYDRLFTEISSPIPQEYADYFKVNGMPMGLHHRGRRTPQQQQAAAIPENTG